MREQVPRKLAAILHADVVGYSRLMGEDESGTLTRLKAHRKELIDPTIASHRGRIVKLMGDGALIEFASVVDALACAVEVQRGMAERNKDEPEDRRIEFRIGINLGDVIVEGDDIYGDGVNVAARLESLAEPAGICISESVYTAVGKKLPIDYEFMGVQEVKNIEQPVRAYHARVRAGVELPKITGIVGPKKISITRMAIIAAAVVIAVVAGGLAWFKPWQAKIEPASLDRMAHVLPSGPSIAVLPFNNLSGDPEQDFLAAGFTQEIITTLSQAPDLFVIARSSTDTYKGKATPAKQVAEEQGVHYVLEGSIQRAGDRIRINAQLIDALEGDHLWAERYDRELKDLFALQDEITHKIAIAMQVELTQGDLVRRRAEGLDPEAYRLAYKADWHMDKFDKENMAKSRELLTQAQAISPNALFPLVMQGWVDVHQARFGWSPSREASLQSAEAIAREVLAKDETYPEALILLGMVHSVRREVDKAIPYYERAIEANPNHSNAVGILGLDLAYAGRPEEAIPVLKKAMRLSPYYPAPMDASIGLAYMMTGEYDKAIKAYKDTLAKDALILFSHERLAAIYAMKGDNENARVHAAKVLEIKPDFSIEAWSKVFKYKRQEDLDRELDALREAGLPERPPLALPDKPSIAVLPFTNLTGDSEQDYFVDGFTNEIITNLSKFPEFFVIASNSVFTYKGKSVRIDEIGRELGVRYVLEGSLQRSSNNISVHAQLIEAASEKHLWAESYEGKPEEIFSVQRDLIQQITSTLAFKVEDLAHAAVSKKDEASLPAYELYLKGSKYKFGKEAFEESARLLERAVEIDPDFAAAYAHLGQRYLQLWRNRLADDADETLRRARNAAQKAIALDQQDYRSHWTLGQIHLWAEQDHDLALAEYTKALALNPNQADLMAMTSTLMSYMGRADDAVHWIEKAKRVNPYHPVWYDWIGGFAYFMARDYEKAVVGSKQTIAVYPKNISARRILIATYVEMGRMEDAQRVAREVLEIDLEYRSSTVRNVPFARPSDHERYFGAHAKAGLPE